MLFFCPSCDFVVEIVGATRGLGFTCKECNVTLERCAREVERFAAKVAPAAIDPDAAHA